MEILSHRGFWKEPDERNSIRAFARSVDQGFGIETDIRDYDGQLVISHDVPVGGEVELEKFLQLFHQKDLPIALNIKADGLAVLIKSAMREYAIRDWFVFDMSVPDMRNCLDEGIPVFARVSEVEKDPPWMQEVVGVWFDSFSGDSYDTERIAGYLREGKRVCIVSPELHKRERDPVWRAILSLSDQTGLMLCTDHPDEAREFFSKDQRR